MDITLTKHQCYELAQFFKVPSQKFNIPSDAQKIYRVWQNLSKSIIEYSKPLDEWIEESGKIMQSKQKEFKIWQNTKVGKAYPTQQQQNLKMEEFHEDLNKLLEDPGKKAEQYAESQGKTLMTIAMDANDWTFAKQYFNREATKHPIWQAGDRINEMTTLIESL